MKYIRFLIAALPVLLLSTLTHAHETGQPHGPEIQAGPQGQARIIVEKEPGANPWTGLDLKNDPRNFQFAIVSDRTGGHRPGVFEDAVRKLNLLQPPFVMSVGDFIEGYTENQDELNRQWTEFLGFTGQLEMPFFYVPGNHDISNPVMAKDWQRRFGRSYYHFVYQDVLFLCLNSEDQKRANISDEQIQYMKAALAANKQVRWTLLFLHEPLWVYEETQAAKRAANPAEAAKPLVGNGWSKLEALLQDRPYTVFAGHFHNYTKYERKNQRYIVLATTGGGSGLRGPAFGEFDHVAWVTMTPEGPRLANLMLSGIWDENVATEKSRALVSELVNSARIVVPTLLTEGDSFNRMDRQLRLVNDADYPLKLHGHFNAHDLSPSPHAIDLTIPPNSVRLIDLKLRSDKPLPSQGMTPLELVSTMTYEVPGQPVMEIKGVQKLVVEKLNTIPRRRSAVVIDGKLNEWKSLPLVCEKPAQIVTFGQSQLQGPQDSSFRFAVEHDDRYLYIAVDTTDDKLVLEPDKEPYFQDDVEVRIDARPETVASQGQGSFQADEELRDILTILMSPGDTADKTNLYARDKLPPGVRAVCVKTPKGHTTEIAVPFEYLNQKQGRPWKTLRINVAATDYDEPGRPSGTYILWRPDWRTKETYPGSGTFKRG